MFKTTTAKLLLGASVASLLGLLFLTHRLHVSGSVTSSSRYSVQPASGVLAFSEQEESSLEKQQRLPKALIIGFSKCGSTALRTFLTIHPDIVSPVLEVRYFTQNYEKGVEWYRQQMPESTERQITLEKTPAYILTDTSLSRIRQLNPKMKLIVIVRDPIVRLQSQYAHVFRNEPEDAPRPPFKAWCQEVDLSERVLYFSNYAKAIRMAYSQFPRDQLLVISEDVMEKNPLSVMKDVEAFLGLRPAFSNDMFYYNEETGFYCFNTESPLFEAVLKMVKINPDTGCLGKMKGREHPDVEEGFRQELVKLITPLNEQLFRLINKRFVWENFDPKANFSS